MKSKAFLTLVAMTTLLLHRGAGFSFPSVGGVDKNRIEFKWAPRERAQELRRLDLSISWPLPSDMTDDKEFLVRLTQDDTHCAENSSIGVYSEELSNMCQLPFFTFNMETSDIRTENNHSVIEALEYGITYTVMVAVLDRRTNETSAPACKTGKSPDCYGITRSREFCQPRCIATSGPPVNLTVASIGFGGDYGNVTELRVSWLRPIQHNDNVVYYFAELVNTEYNLNTHINTVGENASLSDTTPFIAKFTEVEVNVTYTVTVYVYGNFRGQGYERGASVTIELMILPEDLETRSTTAKATTDFRSEGTTDIYRTKQTDHTQAFTTERINTNVATNENQTGITTTAIIIASVTGCFILVILILFVVVYRTLKRRRLQKEAWASISQ
ncbi:uncharacterized protein [Ptychodera flava]|uniref:uncharacterized protein n=1 Tax=Ptychodera flava TaxID=63121 RepID=UPI00396A0E8E